MRNRDSIMSKIENLEGKMSVLNSMVKTGQPPMEFIAVINKTKAVIADLKRMVEREPLTAEEQNVQSQKR